MNFSDYIIYVDESGDHDLVKINPEFPAFALSFCIIHKDIYVNKIVPALQQLKFDFFGHDMVVFHEHEIRKEEKDFAILRTNPILRQNFYNRLNGIMQDAEISIVATTILKNELCQKYSEPYNPYHIALFFCLEKTMSFLIETEQQGKLIHVIAESRGKKEDRLLEEMFLQIVNDGAKFGYKNIDFKQMQFEIKFASKYTNSTGLQLADLTARPIALSALRPTQENRAYEIIKTKFPDTGGIKIFP
jgi:hypothetical protein